jgi:aspartate kinase
MLDLAANGSKILHLRCVEYARRYGIPLHVRSSWSKHPGTWIVDNPYGEGSDMEAPIITGIAHDRSEAKITVVGVPDEKGKAADIFTAVADAGINIDMIVQNVSAAATGLHRHLLHAAAERRPEGDPGAAGREDVDRLRGAAL